jgi:hypothetical protein
MDIGNSTSGTTASGVKRNARFNTSSRRAGRNDAASRPPPRRTSSDAKC